MTKTRVFTKIAVVALLSFALAPSVGAQLVIGGSPSSGTATIFDSTDNQMFHFSASSAFLFLGGTGDDGDIVVRDNTVASTFVVDGQSGNVTGNLTGSGLVKAWARIRDDGTVLACFRCNANVTSTQRITLAGADFYEVDFTSLGTDISDRPRLVTIDNEISSFQGPVVVEVATRSGDASTVAIRFSSVADVFRDFTVIIF